MDRVNKHIKHLVSFLLFSNITISMPLIMTLSILADLKYFHQSSVLHLSWTLERKNTMTLVIRTTISSMAKLISLITSNKLAIKGSTSILATWSPNNQEISILSIAAMKIVRRRRKNQHRMPLTDHNFFVSRIASTADMPILNRKSKNIESTSLFLVSFRLPISIEKVMSKENKKKSLRSWST